MRPRAKPASSSVACTFARLTRALSTAARSLSRCVIRTPTISSGTRPMATTRSVSLRVRDISHSYRPVRRSNFSAHLRYTRTKALRRLRRRVSCTSRAPASSAGRPSESGRDRCPAPPPDRASAAESERCRPPGAASARASRRSRARSSAATVSAARAAARPSPSSTKQRTFSSTAARCPCRSSSSWYASAARYTPSRSFSAASWAVGQSRPAPTNSQRSCPETGSRSPASSSETAAGSHETSSPAERGESRDGGGVARGVAVALLDGGGRDHDLVTERRETALGLRGHEPLRARKRFGGLDRQRRRPLVADEHEHVGLGRVEHELERVVAGARGLGGVERRAAADDGDAALGEAPVGRHLRQPFGLHGDRLPRQVSRHTPSIPWPGWGSSSASSCRTACGS